jgi:hypothetical protein
MEKKEYDKYEKEIEQIGDFVATEVNINPSYYIHNAILKAQQALNDEDIKNGIFKFRFYAENIEVLAKAAEMLPHNYQQDINKFKRSSDYIEEDSLVQHFKLANYKMQLLLGQVFSSRVSTTPLKA